jgi:hypothetical protein
LSGRLSGGRNEKSARRCEISEATDARYARAFPFAYCNILVQGWYLHRGQPDVKAFIMNLGVGVRIG